MSGRHFVTVLHQCPGNALINRLKIPPAGDRACKVYNHFCGNRESREALLRLRCSGGRGPVSVRMLSNSALNPIQSLTKITRWGVLSLKKKRARNIRISLGEM